MIFIGIKYEIIKMLQKESKIINSDNTGVKVLKCINVYCNKKYRLLVDLLSVVINKFRSKKKLIKKQIYFGLIICTKNKLYRKEGIYIKGDLNRILVLNRDNKRFLGTRIYGPIYKELRYIIDGKKKIVRYEKIIAISKKII
jgi:ribosomal protein L14